MQAERHLDMEVEGKNRDWKAWERKDKNTLMRWEPSIANQISETAFTYKTHQEDSFKKNLTFLSTFYRKKQVTSLFISFLVGEESMAEIKLNFISENAEIICWTPYI